MALLTFNGESYDVHHAVKGADYIHGYNANNGLVIAFDGISDFSAYSYTEEYMTPEHCAQENCNLVKHVAGVLVRNDGTEIPLPGARIKTGTYIGDDTDEHTLTFDFEPQFIYIQIGDTGPLSEPEYKQWFGIRGSMMRTPHCYYNDGDGTEPPSIYNNLANVITTWNGTAVTMRGEESDSIANVRNQHYNYIAIG